MRNQCAVIALSTLFATIPLHVFGQQAQQAQQTPRAQGAAQAQQNPQKPTPEDFNLTLTGDSIIMSPASVHQNDPRFMGLLSAIRQGDAAFTNLEETYPSRNAYPGATSGGTWMAADPAMLKELQWMGLNLFAAVNNHSFDFGTQGVLDTLAVLKQDGAAYAGIGETLGEARQPGYLSTAHGRVALVACTSSFLPSAPAGDPRSDMRGRPGINPLHYETIYNVDAATFQTLQKIKDQLLPGRGGAGGRGPAAGAGQRGGDPQRLTFVANGGGLSGATAPVFQVSDQPGVVTKASPTDLAAISRSIQEGRKMADYVVTSIHAHEGVPGPDTDSVPAQFLVEFAHAAIDAGADVFVSHGPHVLRGIEIYKGKVIFYSLGDLWMQDNIVRTLPSDFYQEYGLGADAEPSQAYDARGWDGPRQNALQYQSVVAHVVFHNGHPKEVILTPIALSTSPRADEGVPYLADSTMGNQILEHLQKLSQPFGTNIVIKNGVGTIAISGPEDY